MEIRHFIFIKYNVKTRGKLKIRSVLNWSDKYWSTDGTLLRLYNHGLIGQCFIVDDWIYSFTVNPKYRNRGFGKRIIRKAEKIIAKERKYEYAHLEPLNNDPKLREYYHRLGYIDTNTNEMCKKLRGG